MIPQNIIEDLLSRANIEEYIGRDIQLKKTGANYTGCCPFHNEKTPSFIVSPAKGIFKCFGCGEGGNIIQYAQKRENINFPEAIKHLAKQYGVAIEEREQTPDELELQYKRESIYAVNEAVVKFYISEIAKNKKAHEYALSRWDEDTLHDEQIGYSPDDWTATKIYLLSKQFTLETLINAGLITKSEKTGDYFDFFRGRLMIPIRHRNGHVIGFTARVIGNSQDQVPKFLNTKETIVFQKGKNLFGIHDAFREATKQNKIYIVEGAPDVIRLRSINVLNAVAPLGTALTPDQIKLISRCTKNVVLIPDLDTAGLNAAKKNGEALFKAGFNVSVMLLDSSEGKDADEQFKTRSKFILSSETDVRDWVSWWASDIMGGIINESEKVAGIAEVCDLLAYSEDESIIDSYIETLSKEIKPRKIWNSKIADARKSRQANTVKQTSSEGDDHLRKHGFTVRNNCYYGLQNDGKERQWSNFTITPLAHVLGQNSKRLYTIKNQHGYEQTIEVKQEDLVSLQKFRIKTESQGNFLWEAGEVELHRLKRFLYENTLTCEEISQLGWQKKYGFFAWGNGAFDGEKFLKTNEIGIVSIADKHFYLPAFSKIFRNDPQLFQFERKFVHAETQGISLYDYSEKLIEVFGSNAKITICFLLATLFKDVVTRHTTSFPILNLFGPKGTGKSELGKFISSFFISDNTPPNINNTTIPALAETVAQVCNTLVHIDEYKNSTELDKLEFLKGLWDGTGRTRMNMDRDKKRETTAVGSGVVLTGQEMPTADNALFSRLVFLSFYKDEFSDIERKKFGALDTICKRGLTHLTNEILCHRKKFEINFYESYKQTSDLMEKSLQGKSVNERTFKNWVTVVAAFTTLEPYIRLPFTTTDVMTIATEGMFNQDAKTKQNNEISGWWTTVESLVREVKILDGVDFKIKPLASPTSIFGYSDKIKLDTSKRYLLILFNNMVPHYLKECRSTGAKQLPKDSLKYYLENSPEYIGVKKSERFKRVNSINSAMSVKSAEGHSGILGEPATRELGVITSCMVFDYEAVVEKYGISIEEVFGGVED